MPEFNVVLLLSLTHVIINHLNSKYLRRAVMVSCHRLTNCKETGQLHFGWSIMCKLKPSQSFKKREAFRSDYRKQHVIN